MSTFFIVHGVGGDKNENWFPWIRSELEQAGHTVIVPSFPHTNEPKQPEWLEYFKQYESELTDDAVLIGHSLGAAFALRLLETHRAKAAYLVAAVWGVMENEYDHLMTSFVEGGFDWEKIKKNCSEFHVLHSDNDPYIALTKAHQLAEKLDVKVELIPQAGHFNTSSGYITFPELLESLV